MSAKTWLRQIRICSLPSPRSCRNLVLLPYGVAMYAYTNARFCSTVNIEPDTSITPS